jgi:excisionase family DNA binding protein
MSIMSTGLGHDERRAVAPKPLTITVNTACVLSGFGPTRIWQFIREGRLPVTRVGNRTLIHFAAFEAMLLSPDGPHTARKKTPHNRKAAADAAT